MNEHLQKLEALSRHPSLKVSPEQRPAVVGNILHHLMHPYFLKRTPEMQGKFGEQCANHGATALGGLMEPGTGGDQTDQYLR